MTRIPAAFDRAKSERRAALITYICAGDPSLETTARAVPMLAEAGADVVELGVPFSDPIADGPTIQAASFRSLQRGTTVRRVIDLVAEIRRGCDVPIVLMGYLNPILAMGVDVFCGAAAAAGVDGLIVPDLPIDEASPLQEAATKAGLDLVLLAAPTTTPERLARIGQASRGFLYFVSVAGVTGARTSFPAALPAWLAAARAASKVPVAVGFGISTPEQARQLAPHADGLVVGSAIVSLLAEPAGGIPKAIELVRGLSASLAK